MKFEKLNENQIRCTLTKEDLAAYRVKLSELSYGTDKARSLFKAMMEQASRELDFDVEDIPLMIEAIPIGPECLVLTVTKVEDPEELDTRFARFAPSLAEEREDFDSDYDSNVPGSDELMGMFNQIAKAVTEKASNLMENVNSSDPTPEQPELTRIFSFGNMDDIFKMATVIASEYTGVNALYKDASSGRYLLLMYQSDMDLLTFNRVCNIISEYGKSEKSLAATDAYLDEHLEVIIASDAIHKLASI